MKTINVTSTGDGNAQKIYVRSYGGTGELKPFESAKDLAYHDETHPPLPLYREGKQLFEAGGFEATVKFEQSTFTNGWEEITAEQYNFHYENHHEENQPVHKVRKIYQVVTPVNEKVETEILDCGEPLGLGKDNGILPCPFCGAKEGDGPILGKRNQLFLITCINCNVQTGDDRRDKVIYHWNRRKQPTIPTTEGHTAATEAFKEKVVGLIIQYELSSMSIEELKQLIKAL